MALSFIATIGLALLAVPAKPNIVVSDLEPTIREISSAEYEGRLTLSEGGKKAGGYLENQFRTIGLKPGPGGSYFHTFDVTFQVKSGPDNLFEIHNGSDEAAKGVVDTDFRPLLNSKDGEEIKGEMVFVGYGVHDEAWDDYRGIDTRGKVVVALGGGPSGYRNVSNAEKAEVAAQSGATGLVVVGPYKTDGPKLPSFQRAMGLGRNQGFVAVGVTPEFFQKATGVDLLPFRGMSVPSSRPLPGEVRFKTQLVPNTGKGRNIVGYLPGHDPKLKDELIIIGAHYDHIGHGELGSTSGSDAIHYGADDNASGTAGVVALAKYFATRNDNRRTMVFQLYQGEEMGLLGSTAWVKDHLADLGKTTVMLNMDMIGRLTNGALEVYGVSTADEFAQILKQVSVTGITPKLVPYTRADSDHASFAFRNVPDLFFFTGIHRDYHNEGDTFDKINLEGMAKVASYVAQTALLIDALPQKLQFSNKAQTGNARQDRSASPRDSSRRIRIGFIPDMTGQSEGVALMGASPGSPAEKAGFKAGDVIIKFGDTNIASLEDLQEAMMSAEPGKKVSVVFKRAGKESKVDLVPEARP